ncbi:hypothetical protein SPRG_02284 [Saprolegnia parasitica CBS 223.65]|uniref:Coiled-coil domain-containing protein 22 homolog n=1 Tax=Saprolegnia parasitica (strain CBS 223.65) TaxID=695850 RepID=A0A067D3Z8_SAPPC|nr:hypothetical protein SPRG_02284 [Saprolegnia parasitica CBS 223.65]KDO33476.1 hypothetical protein SPRG_02284 [Saprolegnia parasitica CBS 223.65]|eukprot:XP_012196220.1 hypothetical protein SPRG_02284 [Saprolegnia parasitica CBS 223.65]
MDEADNLIAQTLAESGWSKELPRIGAMAGEDLVPLVAWGLGRIDGAASNAAAPYPKGVAQRHRLAAAFAERIKAHGYNGDCGYNHLLYPSEYDTRQLLLWLVQKLPKVERDDMEEASPEMQVRKTLADALSLWMQAPSSSARASTAMATMPRASPLPDFFSSSTTLARSTYVTTKQPLATDAKLVSQHKQLSLLALNEAASLSHDGHGPRAALLSSVSSTVPREVTVALQSLALAHPVATSSVLMSITPSSMLRPVSVSLPPSAPPDIVESPPPVAVQVDIAALDVQKAHVLALQSQYEATTATIEQLQAHIALATEQEAAAGTQQHTIEAELAALQHDVDIRQQTLDMVADASKNMVKLQTMCDASVQRLASLSMEWAAHRAPLDTAIAAQAATQCAYEEDCRRLQGTIAAYRDEMMSLVESLGQKKAQREALERKYAMAPKAINRSVYTSRIMDIIKQVHKQKADIAKILQDIRRVQKHINVSSEKLKRSEAIAEERLFHAANDASHKSDKRTQYVECYRLFTTIRELFDELIRCVNDGGKRENQTRDLSTWIAQLSNRLNVANCDQIEADLAQVRDENRALMAQLQTYE